MKEFAYHRLLLPAAERMGDKTCVIDGDYRATLPQHVERVFRLSQALAKDLDVNRGDRYAVMALNSHRYLELYHASFLGAGVINPLNLRLAPKELAFILKDSGCKVCFTDFLFAGLIDSVREEAGLERVVLLGEGTDAPHDANYDALLAGAAAEVPDEPEETDPVILMYTGGTTGLPKGVVIDSRALFVDGYKVGTCFPMDERYVYLHQTPMFHAASLGAVLVVPAVGGTTTFVPVFDPARVLEAIETQQVTMTVMVPTMIGMLLSHPEFRPERLASLKTLVYGASPMPTVLLQRVLDLFPELDVFQGYGMTESCGLLTVLGPAEHRLGGDFLRSAGRPLLGTTLSIQDPDGDVLPAGSTGEVCARSGNYMTEYWHRPDETTDVFRGGWYHTGDAGHLDEHGYLYLVDRVKDMIVTGGENVYSAEVENAIASHPAVEQVAVIGIPDDRWGEAVYAIVVLKAGQTATDEEIKAHARELIAGYKVPKEVEFRTEPLPLSGALKVLKRELRAPYWEGRERSVQ